MQKTKSIMTSLLLMAISIVVTLFLMEGLLRLFMPQQLILIRSDIWIPAEQIGWRMASNLETTINTGERTVTLATDNEGNRISAIDPSPAEPAYKILALGDSYLAALQVEYEQTMTAVLDDMLTQKFGASVKTKNTGVGGYDLNHYLIKARQELAVEEYDLIVVYIYMPNDVLESKIEEFPLRQSSVRNFRWPRALTIGEFRDAIAYPINNALETRSHLFIFLKDQARFFLMSQGLSAYNFSNTIQESDAESIRWGIAGQISTEIEDLAAQYDTPTLFVFLPANYQVDEVLTKNYIAALNIDESTIHLDQPSSKLESEFTARGLSFIDMYEPLKEEHAAGTDDLYGAIDTHFGINGHRVTAETIFPVVVDILEATNE